MITNTRTWSLSKNNQVTGDVTRTGGLDDLTNGWKTLWLNIKNQMVAFGWVVEGSSNGVSGAMDAVDRWVAITDLLGKDISGGPLAHSWIVLRNGSKRILFSHGHRSAGTLPASQMVLTMSRNAYTGGSSTVDPTASEEVVLKDGTGASLDNRWIEPDGGDKNLTWHMWYSAGNTRVAVYTSSILQSLWMFETLANAPDGWPTPWLDGIAPGSGGIEPNALSLYWESAQSMWRTYHPNGTDSRSLRAVYGTFCVDFNTGAAATFLYAKRFGAASTVSGIPSVFLYSIYANSSGLAGRLGDLVDVWAEGIQSNGTGYPTDPGVHVHVGDHWVWPWDETDYEISSGGG